MEQNTPEWFVNRLGKATASRFKDIMAMTKNGPSTSRKRYMTEIIAERLTGETVEIPMTRDMLWGVEHEAMAREAVEIELGIMIDQVGFFPHPDMDCGASPDGLTEDYTIEIKCPKSTTHVDTMLYGMPPKHKAQVQGQMWLAGRSRAIFASFDPRMQEEKKLYTQVIHLDMPYVERLEIEIRSFLDEVSKLIGKLGEV